ncbi:hypothetical protein COHA_005895 [Chlorella ohadii]|uniref:Uncharacterized protein n=1 Tax=Chlorella ohadii TaxID=2649997 RepID=A0AAD5H199_9CHLO|nr:hypothetical protein COHA_005895 [Chlorella ohadii]
MGWEAVDKARRQAVAATARRRTRSDSSTIATATRLYKPFTSVAELAQPALANQQPADDARPERTPAPASLSVLVCNGFANQRIAILSGVVLAAELNRTLVLPHLLLDGTQRSNEAVNEDTGAQHVDFWLHCPALHVEAQLMTRNEALVFAALQAMQPARPLRGILDKAETALERLSPSHTFNVLHLRVPLLVLAHWPDASGSLTQQALDSLEANGYTVVRRDELFREGDAPPSLPRELSALVDYHLALRARQFIGNSVSSFSAMLILERRHAGRFAAYYNMPWVFTYNDWSAGTEYDFMVMAAVTSAIHIGRMLPYCLYSGSKLAPAYKWLKAQNVTIIEHEPAWRDAVVAEAARNKEINQRFSHLYSSPGRVVGTFQRIDIPVLPQLMQYEFVLFTDGDVYFRQRIKLVDWGTPLPQAVGMSGEASDAFPYNAGVMLYNMPAMRRSYPAFLEWLLSQKNGHHYGGFGPLDQGAINQYYASELINRPVSQIFNAKPYHPFNPQARIVHFHGFATGTCHYAAEYVTLIPDWREAVSLARLCFQ